MRGTSRRTFALAAAVFFGLCGSAFAHPHVWVTAYEEVIFNKQGQITAITHSWIFDKMYSAFATTGLATAGALASRQQLAPLAKANVQSLKEFSYFTFVKVLGHKVAFGEPTAYWLEERPDKLVDLHFTLPLAAPVAARPAFTFQVYDPTYFVSFGFATKKGVVLVNAPKGCSVNVLDANPASAAHAKKLSEAFFAALGPNSNFGRQMASNVFIACP